MIRHRAGYPIGLRNLRPVVVLHAIQQMPGGLFADTHCKHGIGRVSNVVVKSEIARP